MSLLWLQISAGGGPVECAWAVRKTVDAVDGAARAAALRCHMVQLEPGPAAETAMSASAVCGS